MICKIFIFIIRLMAFFVFSSIAFAEELPLFCGAAFKKPMIVIGDIVTDNNSILYILSESKNTYHLFKTCG